MALVLDFAPGSPTANAYCSVAEADAYHETRAFNTDWTGATEVEKNTVIAWATRLMDQQNYVGLATFRTTGNLRWPRYGLVNREGLVVEPNTIPKFVKEACAEWAFYLLGEDRTQDEGGLVEYGGKTGPIADTTSYVRKPMPESVRDMLRPYLSGAAGSGQGRVLRT